MPELSTAEGRLPAKAPRPLPGARADAPLNDAEARGLLSPAVDGASPVLLAVSGGPDSTALMRLLARLARQGLDCEIEVATVDHGLRPDSRDEANRVGGWARECGFAHRVLCWEGPKPATRIQVAARAARYALLARQARYIGAQTLLTAHTLDDQAETVLMRMAHGSGLAGLAAMRPVSQREGLKLARPLLGIPKARLVATCEAHRWPFLSDPSNADPRFARARWRKLRDALAAEGLTASRLAKLAQRLASAEDALETKAEAAYRKAVIASGREGVVLDAGRLMGNEPREIALRLVLRALAELRAGESRNAPRLERVENILSLLESAFASGTRLRRTLGGAVVAFDGSTRLALSREGPRRRGEARPHDEASLTAGESASRLKRGNSNAPSTLV